MKKFNVNVKLKDNAMLRHHPNLFSKWNFEKNDKSGLDIYEVSRKSVKKVWWICPDCDSEYDMIVANKTKGQKCPYCSGKRVNHTNSLASLMPLLAKEWHPTKNASLTQHQVTCGSNKKIWWLGECGHEWDAVIADRTLGKTGCPYCHNKKILVGFNDMWTTNPELASQLNNSEDGYKHTQFSSKKVEWKCITCGNIIKNRIISNVKQQGLSCSRCSDGMSFPEKFIYNLLKESNIDFEYDSSQEWSKGKRFDFYLPEHNWIIEVHGIQHYKPTFESMRRENSRTFEREVKNDAEKKLLAYSNNVKKYIEIDARYSDVDYIRNNVLNSDIRDMVSKVDFEKVAQAANNSLIKEACDIWNSGLRSTTSVAKKMNIHIGTAQNYLERGVEAGWCDYCSKKSRESALAIGRSNKRIPVVQLDLDNNFIRVWESARLAVETLGIPNTIFSVCKGKQKTSGGFKWLYEEDYNKTLTLNNEGSQSKR